MAQRIRRSISVVALTALVSSAPALAGPANDPSHEAEQPATPQKMPSSETPKSQDDVKRQDAPKQDQKVQSAPSGTSAVVMDLSAIQGLIGKSVTSSAGEDMGRIIDLLVTPSGVVRAAVIDFGGFLGVGSRKVAVDWKALSFVDMSKGGAIRLALTRDQVRVSPEYKSGDPVVILEATKTPDTTKPADAKPTAAATAPNQPDSPSVSKAPEAAGK